jgi:hypothetical protein
MPGRNWGLFGHLPNPFALVEPPSPAPHQKTIEETMNETYDAIEALERTKQGGGHGIAVTGIPEDTTLAAGGHQKATAFG